MELVSIVVSTYNSEKTIERTLNSLLNQTYENIEIICCDDCSSDLTYDILCSFEKKYERISIYKNKENSKAAFTRNFAMSKTKGNYIVQSDDDDYYNKNKIKLQVDYLKANTKIDFVGTNAHIFDDNGTWGEWIVKEFPQKKDMLKTNPFINTSLMFRKEVYHSIDPFYRSTKDTNRGEDYDLMMRLYVLGKKGSTIQKKLTYYRRDIDYNKKTSYRDRIGEFKFRLSNFKQLKLLPMGLVYAVKPLIVGLIPIKLLEKFHRSNLKFGTKNK